MFTGAAMCHMDYPRSGHAHEFIRYHSSRFRHVHGRLRSLHRQGATCISKFSEAVRTGLIFGAIETLTPLVGWGLGMLASSLSSRESLDCLYFTGVSRRAMIVRRFRGDSDEARAPHRHGFWLRSPPPSPPALTRWPSRRSGLPAGQHCDHRAGDRLRHPIMSTLGMMVGRFIGPLLKRAEILGGIVLIGIGSEILWSHFAG